MYRVHARHVRRGSECALNERLSLSLSRIVTSRVTVVTGVYRTDSRIANRNPGKRGQVFARYARVLSLAAPESSQ